MIGQRFSRSLVGVLEANGVELVCQGPNVARGNVNVKCPFCGDDPSHHLGIRISDGAWGCWRNSSHRGRRPHRLLNALLGWTWAEVDAWLESPIDRSLLDDVSALFGKPESLKRERKVIDWPPEILPLHGGIGPRWAYGYLRKRGFDDPPAVAEAYGLRYALRGPQAHRVVFPVVDESNRLLTYTGRAVSSCAFLRYVTAPASMSEPIRNCVLNLNDLLFNAGRVLVITEGPFDAVKLDWYGRRYGVRATCIFGSSCSARQASIIRVLGECYERIFSSLDAENVAGTLSFMESVPDVLVRPVMVPGASDWGELSKNDVERWCRSGIASA